MHATAEAITERTRFGLTTAGAAELRRLSTTTITLFRAQGGWHARVTGADEQRIRALFDCNVLPTAYTDKAPANYVIREIERRNPTANVVLHPAEPEAKRTR
jgi:hypothetical protein